MLISADFVASDYCYTKEMELALERHRAGQARAISIICRPCHFHALPFAKFVLLPTDAKPVSSWGDRDAAWVDVVTGTQGREDVRPADLDGAGLVQAGHQRVPGDGGHDGVHPAVDGRSHQFRSHTQATLSRCSFHGDEEFRFYCSCRRFCYIDA